MLDAIVAGITATTESAGTAVKEAVAHITHDTVGDIEAVNVTEVLAVEESSSGGAQAIDKQQKLRQQRREARRLAHAEHDTRHFTKGMFWDSVKIQSMLLTPMFAASLALSAWLPQAFVVLDVVFVGLGAYIGLEVAEMAAHLRKHGNNPKRHKPAAQAENNLSPSAVFHRYKNNLTFKTCVEVGLGVIAGIHHLPLWQQMIVFPLCGTIMMVAPPVVTNTLLWVEHIGTKWAQRLRELQPKSIVSRFALKRECNVKLGNLIEDTTIRMFDAMPWLGVLAKVMTCGRLDIRGIEPIEAAVKHYASNPEGLVAAWSVAGAVVVGVMYAGNKAVTATPRLTRAAVLPLTIAIHSPRRVASGAMPRRYDSSTDILGTAILSTSRGHRQIYMQKEVQREITQDANRRSISQRPALRVLEYQGLSL